MAAKPPSPFDFSNPSGWTEWLRRYSRYHNVTKMSKEDDSMQIDSLLYTMGEAAEDIFLQLSLTGENRKKYAEVVKAFDGYFTPKTNKAHHIVQFNGRTQSANETNEEYIRILHSLAQKCDFGTNREDNIKYRLLTGMKDKTLSVELQQLSDDNLTLEAVTSRMRAKEVIQRNLELAAPEQPADVDAIYRHKQ